MGGGNAQGRGQEGGGSARWKVVANREGDGEREEGSAVAGYEWGKRMGAAVAGYFTTREGADHDNNWKERAAVAEDSSDQWDNSWKDRGWVPMTSRQRTSDRYHEQRKERARAAVAEDSSNIGEWSDWG